MLTLALLGGCAVVLGAAFALRFRRVSASLRGPRIVTCPETDLPAVVEVGIPYSAVRSAFGRPHLRLRECSRWPAHERCGRTCLGDLEASPEDTRLSRILGRFYAGRHCVLCGWAFGWVRNESTDSAFLGGDGVTHQWRAFAVDTLPALLRSAPPVCWSCHVRQSLRRSHPEIFRPPDGTMPVM